MTRYRYTRDAATGPALGLIVLQVDETIETEFRRMFPPAQRLHISRVPSGAEVSPDSLQAMAGHLTQAAALFPPPVSFAAVGYGCTSGTAQIGAEQVAALVGQGARTQAVTQPVSALIAACRALGLRRIGMLSPYVAAVSARLRGVLDAAGVATPVFGSFDEAEEAAVARIDTGSVVAAARDLAGQGGVDGLFLSCTNLRTLPLIDGLEAELDLPVLSSNQVLAWHMARLADVSVSGPGRLFQTQP